MAGTAAVVRAAKHVVGPQRLFLLAALPASGSKPTLFTDGTPDATSSPNAVFIGGTKAGGVWDHTVKIVEEFCDEETGPIRTHVEQESLGISGDFQEFGDLTLLSKIDTSANLYAGSGFNLLQMGGGLIVPAVPIISIAQNVTDPTKYDYCIIYAAYSKGGFKIPFTKKADGASPFAFSGLTIPSRTNLDKMGHIGIGI